MKLANRKLTTMKYAGKIGCSYVYIDGRKGYFYLYNRIYPRSVTKIYYKDAWEKYRLHIIEHRRKLRIMPKYWKRYYNRKHKEKFHCDKCQSYDIETLYACIGCDKRYCKKCIPEKYEDENFLCDECFNS